MRACQGELPWPACVGACSMEGKPVRWWSCPEDAKAVEDIDDVDLFDRDGGGRRRPRGGAAARRRHGASCRPLSMTRPRGGSATRVMHGDATAKAATSDELVHSEARGRRSASAQMCAGRHSAVALGSGGAAALGRGSAAGGVGADGAALGVPVRGARLVAFVAEEAASITRGVGFFTIRSKS
uniref:Uncharacterized protein n=2 Tax=Arundo donax TaxID=35708 RepID=A0A0A8ZXX3_ARUDO